jgi:transcriptional regulator GlxA family with amidase domain
MTVRIGIVLFPDAEELDWAGPYEVFGMAASLGLGIEVSTIAESSGLIRCAKGLQVQPGATFETAPPLDVVVVPGGVGSRTEMKNERMLAWLRGVAADCTWITSVCTGAAILCEAGLARGCKVTTHWAYVETLRKAAPDSEVLEKVRYVRDGRLVTAAGVSAGIDMSLWLVGQILGVEQARNVQRMMEYDPAPPYTAEV